jgi:hypothetical protein
MPDQPRPYRIKGGIVVPALTVAVFALLAVAVLADDPWARINLALVFLVSLVYVNTAVPYLKKKYEARKPAARRRPSRATGGVEEN